MKNIRRTAYKKYLREYLLKNKIQKRLSYWKQMQNKFTTKIYFYKKVQKRLQRKDQYNWYSWRKKQEYYLTTSKHIHASLFKITKWKPRKKLCMHLTRPLYFAVRRRPKRQVFLSALLKSTSNILKMNTLELIYIFHGNM